MQMTIMKIVLLILLLLTKIEILQYILIKVGTTLKDYSQLQGTTMEKN